MAIARRRRVRRRAGRSRRGRGLKGYSGVGIRGAYPTLGPSMRMVGRKRNAVRVGRRFRRRYGTRVKRSRPVADPGGYTQWCTYKASRKLGRLTQTKVNFLNNANVVFLWRNMARFGGQGNMNMNHFYDTTAGTIAWPMYLWDLTSYGTGANPCMTPQRVSSGVQFPVQQGYTDTGALSGNWIQFRADQGVTSVVPRGVLNWVDARFDLWGCKAQPTKYTISLVQFDPDYVPFYQPATFTDVTYVDYWDQLAKRLTYNPSVKDPPQSDKRICKTLWKREFLLNPTSTTETDADPHVRSVKFFWKFNRRCDFTWKYTDSALTALADIESNKFEVSSAGDLQVYVQPRARVFLMVSATKFVQDTSYAAQTTSATPTINAQIRTAWRVAL